MTKDTEGVIRRLKELCKAPVIIVPGTIKSVDESQFNCVVVPIDGPDLAEVRLKAAIDGFSDGIVQIPTVGSTVLVAMIGNDENEWFVIAFSRVDKVVFYGGSNDGVVKVVPLVEKLNALENKVNDIIEKHNSHTHTGVSTGGGTSGTPPISIGGELAETVKEDLANEKILH